MVMEAPVTSGIQVAPNPPTGPAMAGGVQMVTETPLPPRIRGTQQPTTFVPMQQMGQLQMGQQLIVQQQPQSGSTPLAAAQSSTGQSGQQQGAPSNLERIIGMEFVRQYYTMLHERPHLLHRFYGKESFFLHGSSGEEETTIVGSDAIKHKFEGMSPKECFTRIFHVDCQNSISNSVVVQVFGELTTGGESRRQFVQTFVLANQAHRSYYIINDIFRYVSRSSSPTGATSPVGGVTTGSEGGLKSDEMPPPVVQAPLRPRGLAAGKEASGEPNGPSSARPPSVPHSAAAAAAANTDVASTDETSQPQAVPEASSSNLSATSAPADAKSSAPKLETSARMQTSYHSEAGNASLTIATSSYVHTQTTASDGASERVRNSSVSVTSGAGAGASSTQEAASDTSESKRPVRAAKAGKTDSATSTLRTETAFSNGGQRAPPAAEQPSKEDRTSPTPSGGQQGNSRESEAAKSRNSAQLSWANIAAKAPAPGTTPAAQPAPAVASTTTPNEKVQKAPSVAPKKLPTVEAQTQAGRQSPTPGDPTIGEVEVTEVEEAPAGDGSVPVGGEVGRAPWPNEYRGRPRGPPPPNGDELYVTMLPADWNEENVFKFFQSLKLGVVTFARWPPERPYCFVRMESAEAAQQVLNYAKQFNTDKTDPTFRIPIPGMDPKVSGRGIRVELRRPNMGPQGGGMRRSDMMGPVGMGMMSRGRDREQRQGPPAGQPFVPPTRSSGGYARSGSGSRVATAVGGAPAGGRGSIGKPSA